MGRLNPCLIMKTLGQADVYSFTCPRTSLVHLCLEDFAEALQVYRSSCL